MIGGFSQGAVMAYALALAKGRPSPAGLLAMSGFIPEVEGFELDLARPGLPIAITHGTLDPIIGVEFASRGAPAPRGRRQPACCTASRPSATASTPPCCRTCRRGCEPPWTSRADNDGVLVALQAQRPHRRGLGRGARHCARRGCDPRARSRRGAPATRVAVARHAGGDRASRAAAGSRGCRARDGHRAAPRARVALGGGAHRAAADEPAGRRGTAARCSTGPRSTGSSWRSSRHASSSAPPPS